MKRNKHKQNDVTLIGFYRPDNGTMIWRLSFLKGRLESKGYTVALLTGENKMKTIFEEIEKSKKVIFCRPSLGNICRDVMRFCIDKGIPFAIDIDDAMFHDEVFEDGCFLSRIVSHDKVKQGYKDYADCYLYADRMIVSTAKIKELLWEKYNKEAIVVPNVIPSSLCNKKQNSNAGGLKLLYASGTATHLFDLSTIYLDLLAFLQRHSDVTLTILGNSINKRHFLSASDRVTNIPLVSFNEMLKIYSEHNLLLVPLSSNSFNDAKSNIKYIEAGAVGTATLAKECAEFRAAITDGTNGFLYNENFEEKLEEIYNNRRNLARIGENAHADVVKNHSTQCELNKELLDWLNQEAV